jgi:hypothetical protein
MTRVKPALLRYVAAPIAGVVCLCGAMAAHDPIATKITRDREIVRIIDSRCASCHQQGGKAFSLNVYENQKSISKGPLCSG